MIQVQDIKDRLLQALDAEDADFYRDAEDIFPAINSSMEWLVLLLNLARERRKVSNEVFKELRVAEVFQASKLGRVSIENSIWSIDSVIPLPDVKIKHGNLLLTENDISVKRDNLIHLQGKEAQRLTSEEFGMNMGNPFKAGNTIEKCKELIRFSYKDPIYYKNSFTNDEGDNVYEIDISPRDLVKNKLVTVIYVKNPNKVSSINESIPFSNNFINLIWQKALQFISWKEGDNTTLFSVTENDLNKLTEVLMS